MQACGSWTVALALVSIVQAHTPEPPNGTDRGTSAPRLVCTGRSGRGCYVLAGHTKVQVAGDRHLTHQHKPILTPHGVPCYKQLSCEYPPPPGPTAPSVGEGSEQHPAHRGYGVPRCGEVVLIAHNRDYWTSGLQAEKRNWVKSSQLNCF